MKDANHAGTSGHWTGGYFNMRGDAVLWVESLEYAGYSDWRLPSNLPVDGSAYNEANERLSLRNLR